jgi:ribosomal protein L37E
VEYDGACDIESMTKWVNDSMANDGANLCLPFLCFMLFLYFFFFFFFKLKKKFIITLIYKYILINFYINYLFTGSFSTIATTTSSGTNSYGTINTTTSSGTNSYGTINTTTSSSSCARSGQASY